MKIYKDIEIESSDLPDRDLFELLEERIESKYIFSTKEYQKEKQGEIDLMVEKLAEIRVWLLGY